MSVYARFKRSPDGFRKLVELLETTPMSRRQKMIDIGMAEDPEYTRRALEMVMTFKDIIGLPEMELAEVCAKTPPRMLAYALNLADEPTQTRFLRCSKPRVAAELKDFLSVKIGPAEVGGAQLKVVETARDLERQGFVRTKKISV
jgi:flagellar motor switch protein FliG